MAHNPLFSKPNTSGGDKPIEPGNLPDLHNRMSAVDLARQKLKNIYGQETTLTSALEQPVVAVKPESVHQRYMRELSSSGKSLAEIQTAWHNYYVGLPDTEKHQVWQEFYSTNSRQTVQAPQAQYQHQPARSQVISALPNVTIQEAPRVVDTRRPLAIRERILKQVKTEAAKPAKSKSRQKFESLFFGLAMGGVAILFFLFSFFNEFVVAPFIQPSRNASATPIILNTEGVAPSPNPEVIIPKIGVQAPVDYSLQTVDEAAIQNALDSAVVHYSNTVMPGQKGNTAVFGHSSNNIFNKGSYKFIFLQLHKMQEGDIFYLTKDSKIYAYKVFKKQVVTPDETWVLNPVEGKIATATLITCDPPGSVSHRMVVWGEQISPDPLQATEPTQQQQVNEQQAPPQLAGKGPSAWNRFWGWVNPFN